MGFKRRVYAIGESWVDDAGNHCTVRDNGTISVVTVNNEVPKTIQSEKDSCDINKILAKFGSTVLMDNVRHDQPMYGDFSNVSDYQSAVIQAQAAEEAFMSLPAAIRKRFSNDPGELIDFLENSENRSEAIKLGLIVDVQDDQSLNIEVPTEGQKESGPTPT